MSQIVSKISSVSLDRPEHSGRMFLCLLEMLERAIYRRRVSTGSSRLIRGNQVRISALLFSKVRHEEMYYAIYIITRSL